MPRPAWKYPGCFPKGFEGMLPKLLGTDNFLHLFCGMSKVGYTVDLEDDLEPDLVADVHNLSMIKDESYEGAFADPPYTRDFSVKLYGKEYPKYGLWTKEMVKKVKVGGRIAIMHNWVVPRLPGCEYIKILVIITRIKQYPKIVTIQRKTLKGGKLEFTENQKIPTINDTKKHIAKGLYTSSSWLYQVN